MVSGRRWGWVAEFWGSRAGMGPAEHPWGSAGQSCASLPHGLFDGGCKWGSATWWAETLQTKNQQQSQEMTRSLRERNDTCENVSGCNFPELSVAADTQLHFFSIFTQCQKSRKRVCLRLLNYLTWLKASVWWFRHADAKLLHNFSTKPKTQTLDWILLCC